MSHSPEATLKGVLERIVYSNPENHFCVAELKPEGDGDTVTVTGTLPQVQCGETLFLEGVWENHRQHGRQLKILSFRTELPASVYGVRKYLGSGLVPGVGKIYANKIVDAFGADTLHVISEDSGRLREVPGIGPKRAREIKSAWDSQQVWRSLMMFLQTYGVGVRNALRLTRLYGNDAERVLREDPYRIAREVDGIGFKTADQIARNLGLGNESAVRIDAGTIHLLKEMEQQGHTGLPQDLLVESAARMLEVEPGEVSARLQHLRAASHLTEGKGPRGFWQSPYLQRAEQQIVYSLQRLSRTKSGLPPIHIDRAVEWAQQRSRVDFAPAQTAAITMALTEKVSVLTGGPGTGKTTILRALVQILEAKKVRTVLAAPTGRAAQRMGEATGKSAATLHRLLRFDPQLGGFAINEDRPLKADYVIIDESSMLDTPLAAALIRALPSQSHLLLVGDSSQLPSVGPGQVLHDVMGSGMAPVTRLDRIFRQRSKSGIVAAAHSILEGCPAVPAKPSASVEALDDRLDFSFIPTLEPEDAVGKVLAAVRRYREKPQLAAGGLMDVQVLAPMHRGVAGVAALNRRMQEVFNPTGTAILLGDLTLREGDKVIQQRNNYDLGVFNGDMGSVSSVLPDGQGLRVDFDGREVDYARSDLGDLGLAYAITIHKSQGSEFPVVIIPLLKQHFMLLQRNLIYTAITRGRRKVLLIGDPAAYAMAVQNAESRQRHTGLLSMLE